MHAWVGVVVLAGAVGCAGADGRVESVAVRDSAGVRIVESLRPVTAGDSAWRLAARPSLELGGAGATGPQEFGDVSAVRRLADGVLVVADGESRSLRFFDRGGRFILEVGRKGAGPGEFESLDWLQQPHRDTLLVYDSSLRRLSIFTAAGAFIRAVAFRPTDDRPAVPVGRFADGSYLTATGTVFFSNQANAVHRDTVVLRRADGAGEVLGEFGRVPGSEKLVLSSARFVMSMDRPFGRRTTRVLVNDLVYVGSGDDWTIRVFDASGRLVRIVRRRTEPRPVRDADVSRYREQQRARMQGADEAFSREYLQMLDEADYPTTLPAFHGFLPTSTGGLWVRRAALFPDEEPAGYDLFDPDGRWLGSLAAPARFTVQQIDGADVIGIAYDADDVPSVQVYPLLAPEGH